MPTPTFVPIASEVLTSTASSVTFSNIPTIYKHLNILAIAKSTSGSNNWVMDFNNGASGGYRYFGHGGTAGANVGAYISSGSAFQTEYYGYLDTTLDAVREIWIPNYQKTDRWKSVMVTQAANQNNGFSKVAGWWMNTSAITSVRISINAQLFTIGSSFQLYGIIGG